MPSVKSLGLKHEGESGAFDGAPDSSSGSSDESAAFGKVLRLVKVRDRSIKETKNRLMRDGFDEAAADAAISKAIDYRFLDDARFADTLVRSRLRQGKGLDGIVRELRGHGIVPNEVLPGFPDEYLAERPSQEDCAYALLCRKPPRAKNARQAAYAKLVRAGYPMALSAAVASKWFYATKSAE